MRFLISFWSFATFSPRLQFNYSGGNIIPLKTISTYFLKFHHYNFDIWFYNTVGNVIVFMPLGFLVPLTFKNFKRLPQIILASIILSFSIELTQHQPI
ncbi:VanZ family protein [Radiobacillus deserti]|uniref:VanZ family protein n=1 Tax=Radiobacillus deserti TaxID=2594883 RepID=A0A516KLG4_9BACI|nr:VanZ family protein [Radiobacillus deserti]